MSVPARFEPLDPATQDRRGAPRLLLSLGTQLGPCGSAVTIHDLSRTGLLFETSADLTTGDKIEVQLPEAGPTRAVVVWREHSLFGCRFEERIPGAAVSAALLRSEPVRSPGEGADQPSDSATPAITSSKSRAKGQAWAGAAAALVVAGLSYQVVTGGSQTLAIVAVTLSLLVALLVLWGLWVVDNTLDLKL